MITYRLVLFERITACTPSNSSNLISKNLKKKNLVSNVSETHTMSYIAYAFIDTGHRFDTRLQFREVFYVLNGT